MTTLSEIKPVKKQELFINGMLFKEHVTGFDVDDGVWTFDLDNGSIAMATGDVLFVDDKIFFMGRESK